ncbi:MAG: YbaB/EbfC family nucleoid-associated protein [Bacteroidota bacterium]
MFGDMKKRMKEMQEKQENMKNLLAETSFSGVAGDGAVTVTCSGDRRIMDVAIDTGMIDPNDTELLEDLLVEATNRALQQAAEFEADQASGMMKDILPPGMGRFFR